MGRGKRSARSARVEAVGRRIEHWRRVRAKRSPMPAELWESAVSLARVHGVYAIARALRLNYETLKQRAGRGVTDGRDGTARSDGFVALDAAQLVAPAGSVVELCGADGAQLRIRLVGGEALDVGGLAEAFWRRGA